MATNGLVVMTPTSIAYSGTSASINADGSVSFSAVTSLSLNGVFTADYDNYQVVVRGEITTSDSSRMRLRASGTDNSTASSYTFQFINAASTTITAGRSSTDHGRFTSLSDSESGCCIYIFGPYLAQPTAFRTVGVMALQGGRFEDFAMTHNQSSSYDGLTIYPAATNFTGLVTVFGFNQ